jgi:VWFA-related protein
MIKLLAAACLSLTLCSAAAAQDAADPPTQTFRSAVDLVPADVSVVDNAGRPVTGLESADFSLTVDGRPRTIVSAQYIESGDVPAAAPVPATYSTNTAAIGGRLLMIVVDRANIATGNGRLVLEAASRFVSRLGPADRVGLAAIPGAGPEIDFTSNHEIVQSTLPKLVGLGRSGSGLQRIGTAEATAIERGDVLRGEEVFSRECAGARGDEIADCRRRLQAEAAMVSAEVRERSRNSLIALRSLIDWMAMTPGPKTLVLLSEGLVLDRDFGAVAWIGPAAARAEISVYVVQLDATAFDAMSRRISPTRNQDLALGREGLDLLAGAARGAVLRPATAAADDAFARLSLELSGYYLLSFSPEPGDRDGRPHKIRIQLPRRKGIEVRSRAEFVVQQTTALSDQAALSAVLRAPLLATDIPLRVTTYTLQDAETGRPRVLVAAEIDRARDAEANLALGFIVADADGTVVASQLVPSVESPVRPGDRMQTYTASAVLPAQGAHTLKLAVVDGHARRGSVERAFDVRERTIGQVRMSDLLIAERTSTASGGLLPTVGRAFTSAALNGYLELSAETTAALDGLQVTFEVASTPEGPALDSAAGRFAESDHPGRRTVEGSVPIGLLPPGEYVARAVVRTPGGATTSVARPFTMGTPDASAAVADTTAMRSTASVPVAFASRMDAFDAASVLQPQVVGFFVDRMNVGAAGPSAAGPALDLARAGRFDAAVDALKGVDDRLAAAFLGGLALYARGELEAAAGRFREAIKIDSNFFPAIFYLGSCYAAGGRDTEAAGAWQTSLVTESDAPFIYTLLADALLRLRETDQALDILGEARSLWPDSAEVALRLGTAHALAGHRAEALDALEPYLAAHPDDVERLFVALRVLYDAHAAGAPVRGVEEDRRLFVRYAEAYKGVLGSQAALVEEWRKAVEK